MFDANQFSEGWKMLRQLCQKQKSLQRVPARYTGPVDGCFIIKYRYYILNSFPYSVKSSSKLDILDVTKSVI